jgi:hypothetical protein
MMHDFLHWLLKWVFTIGTVWALVNMIKTVNRPFATRSIVVGRKRFRKTSSITPRTASARSTASSSSPRSRACGYREQLMIQIGLGFDFLTGVELTRGGNAKGQRELKI